MSNPTKVVFTLPTTNSDGTALDPANITGIKLEILDSQGKVESTTVVEKANLNLDSAGNGFILLPTLPNGSYSVVLLTEAVSQGVAVESVASPSVPFVIVIPSIPNPPVAVSVV